MKPKFLFALVKNEKVSIQCENNILSEFSFSLVFFPHQKYFATKKISNLEKNSTESLTSKTKEKQQAQFRNIFEVKITNFAKASDLTK